ncbi:hypothetical protein [Enterobacter sp. CC120223-11]|uniref:hypothetical protein n=1 Tax=Enterobacter sp. CC120223-11 TaxID=1378073 RepID=UPI000BD8CA36|nr:hypothetical protein [Enterobacter sp. CC120223-11]SNY61434.1 hypothetical protein SAMN02744775_00571 [Enterobacter sp. CC120223-11]
MRELHICEINEVSGAGFFSQIGAGILGGILGATTGMMKAGIAAGNTGGILGMGIFSALVGLTLGGIGGVIQGASYGLVNDWDKTVEQFNGATEYWFDLSNNNPK